MRAETLDVTNAAQCLSCRHAGAHGRGTCAAFPAGIPRVMLMDEADHRRPYPGDGGVRFEAKPGRRHPLDVVAPRPTRAAQPSEAA